MKAKAARKLTFTEFKRALEDIAVKKVTSAPQCWCLIMCPQPVVLQGLNTTDIEEAIINSGGPKSQATKADYVKFHDDKSTYTGTYARRVALSAHFLPGGVVSCNHDDGCALCRGGPTNVDGQKDLSSLTDRTPADNKGVPTTNASAFHRSH